MACGTVNINRKCHQESLMAASQDLLIGTSETVDNEDMRLRIVVRKFHITPAQNAHLAFAAVIKDKSGKIISSTNYDISEPITGSGYESAVLALEKAMSQAIEDLVSDIKGDLNSQPRCVRTYHLAQELTTHPL